MKITPVDIQQHTFKVGFRGYDRTEVEAFLRSVSQTVEELVKENALLKEHVETMEVQIEALRKKENALNDLLVTTQTMAENLKQTARREADLILKEAEFKAEDLLKKAREEYGELQKEIMSLQKQRVLALEKFRALVQTFSKMIELEELDQEPVSEDPAGKGARRDRYEGA
jgi:cell division initiation protein